MFVLYHEKTKRKVICEHTPTTFADAKKRSVIIPKESGVLHKVHRRKFG